MCKAEGCGFVAMFRAEHGYCAKHVPGVHPEQATCKVCGRGLVDSDPRAAERLCFPCGKAEGVSDSGGEGASVGAGKTDAASSTPEKKQRKAPKEGLCKRRGCKEPVADVASRLCIGHLPNGAGVAPEDPQGAKARSLPEGLTGCLPVAGQEVEIFYGTTEEPWRREKVITAEGRLFQAGPVTYFASEEGKTWRWPQAGAVPATETGTADTEPHAVDLTVTHGKNGVPELPAAPESGLTDPLAIYGVTVGSDVEVVAAIGGDGRALWARTVIARVAELGFYVSREGFEEYRFAFRDQGQMWRRCGAGVIVEEHEQPNDGDVPPVRTCIGVPGAVGDEICHTVLGSDVVGDRCSRCAWGVAKLVMARSPILSEEQARILRAQDEELCGRGGCGRPHDVGSRYCIHHRKLSEAAARVMLREAMDAAWEAARDICDPDTYELLRKLRDAEVSL